MSSATPRPVIALAMGDPAGISAELTAKLIADPEVRAAADLLVVGDRRILAEGEHVAKLNCDMSVWRPGTPLAFNGKPVFVDLGHLDPRKIERGVASADGGRFAMTNFRTVLRLSKHGVADAATFTPFNKHAMKLGAGHYDDEIAIVAEETGQAELGREFNILGDLWNARITSHIPLKDVSAHLSAERIVEGLVLTDTCMREAGYAKPRIAVAALNPHAGDGGNFGMEEIEIIEPAVAAAKAKGIACEGPFPSDTVFVRAKRGDFDAVQTMFHDQGQIAMKLMGFEAGITLIGGYQFPVCTPAHGTAYDIAGQGKANLGASRNAILIAARMAKPKGMSAADRARVLDEIIAR
ncbi:MAG: 4-hydroxythreonine-4-phosphate dehydrogenase PdxA [Proteobacteria bacterium]|nr:4-hydroxythreonine-4-phosphate dehydrogenase PdxA [Pseudomonadota bacterium]